MLNLINIGKTWEVMLLDGEVIHIKKPTQGQLIKLYKMADDFESGKNVNELKQLNNIVKNILNNNTENKSFDDKYITDNLTIDHLYALFEGYMQFIAEIETSPN